MKAFGLFLFRVVLAGILFFPLAGMAQTYPDSTVSGSRPDSTANTVTVPAKDTTGMKVSAKPSHSVKKATILSAVLPGAGQVYNRKYWKLPILYGAFAGLGYLIHFNNKEYQVYNDALVARQDDDPGTIDSEFSGKYSDENLRSLSDYYHRNRDLCIVLTVLVYALNVMDAHVDAHLYSFDVSDDLSMRIQPVLMQSSPYMGMNGLKPGLGVSLKF